MSFGGRRRSSMGHRWQLQSLPAFSAISAVGPIDLVRINARGFNGPPAGKSQGDTVLSGPSNPTHTKQVRLP